MKDFDLRKFLTENKITAASQQVAEAGEPKRDRFQIFLATFDDGKVFLGTEKASSNNMVTGQDFAIKLHNRAIKLDPNKQPVAAHVLAKHNIDKAEQIATAADVPSAKVKLKDLIAKYEAELGPENVLNKKKKVQPVRTPRKSKLDLETI